MTRVAITRFEQAADLQRTLQEALAWVRVSSVIPSGARVFIKPNLTWREPTPGVTTTPQAIRVLVEALLPITRHITLGESNGGQDCFWAEDAFASHGLYALRDEYGVRVVNLSKEPSEECTTTVRSRPITVRLPSILVRDTDVFITMPVPKIHAMTGVSLTHKNQWGCLGDSMRVTAHPRFNTLIVAINKLLAPKLAVCDGTYFLNHTGPMMGEPVPMNTWIVSDDISAASIACCEIMQLNYRAIGHHRTAIADGQFADPQIIEYNTPVRPFIKERFYLRRAPINYIHLAAFNSERINRIFYNSSSADLLHELLWLVRRNGLVKQFLYGRFGSGSARRHGAY